MTHFVLSGYFGFDNAGDEAILSSMVASFKKKFPLVEITVLSNNPEKTSMELGVHAIDRWKYTEIISLLRHSDCLISGGGSLLQDVTGLKSLAYYLGVVRLAKLFGKPVFFYAQGIGPVQSSWGRTFMKYVVNKVDYITVRDKQSEQDLLEMDIFVPKITVTADPVLAMEPCSDVTHPKMISVCVRDWSGEKKYWQALADVCDDYAKEGYEVFFIPFHYPQDLEISKEIAVLMQNQALVIEKPLTVDEICSALAHSEVVIGMRYHALVLAAINNVPFVGIDYDPKVTRFLKQTGMPSAGKPENVTAASLRTALRQIYGNPEIKTKLAEKVAYLRGQAQKTNELLVKFMNGEI